MDFIEAERRFRVLEDQRGRGVLTLEQYRVELGRLRVKDQYDRLWMQQEQTGQWFVHYKGAWMAAVPPHKAVPTAPSAAQQTHQQPARQHTNGSRTATPSPGVSFDPLPGYEGGGQRQPSFKAPLPNLARGPKPRQVRAASQTMHVANQVRVGKQRGPGCLGTILSIVIGVPVVFGVIAVIVYFISDQDPTALLGVAIAAAISVLLSVISALQNWKGTITEIRTVRERSTDDEGYSSSRTVTYAWLQKPNGRTKKVRCHPDWRVGDQVEKRMGEFAIRHYPM